MHLMVRTSNGPMKVNCHKLFHKLIRRFNKDSFVDEPEFGSGAGSGADNYGEEDVDTEGGDDDDDDDVGSGQGEFDPIFGKSTTSTTTTSVVLETQSTTQSDLGVDEVPSSTTVRPTDRVEDNTVNVLDGGKGSGSGSDVDEKVVRKDGPGSTQSGTDTSSGTTTGQPQMSIVRAVVTYFFPIFVAWFGGIFSVLL